MHFDNKANRKESVDLLFEANNAFLKNNDKQDNQGDEEIVNEEEGSIVNQDEEFSYDEEDFGRVFNLI